MVPIYTLHIQMELCQRSLYDYLKSREKVDSFGAFLIVSQIVSGLHFLNSNCIAHRDLKPANILIGRERSQEGGR